MTGLVIPNGFELVAFSSDQLPAFLKHFSVMELFTRQPQAFLNVAPLPGAKAMDPTAADEEFERWDGLS